MVLYLTFSSTNRIAIFSPSLLAKPHTFCCYIVRSRKLSIATFYPYLKNQLARLFLYAHTTCDYMPNSTLMEEIEFYLKVIV